MAKWNGENAELQCCEYSEMYKTDIYVGEYPCTIHRHRCKHIFDTKGKPNIIKHFRKVLMCTATLLKTFANGFAISISEYTRPRANGAKRRSGRKPGARVTNSALAEFKVVAHGSKGGGMS